MAILMREVGVNRERRRGWAEKRRNGLEAIIALLGSGEYNID